MRTLACQYFIDRNGNPLTGSLYVYTGTGSTLESLYATDGTTAVSNPIPVAGGRLSQPILFNSDAVSWALKEDGVTLLTGYDRVDSKQNTTSGLAVVNNVATLRTAASSASVGDVVVLLGYTSAGDKPSLAYRYSGVTSDENGGTSISGWHTELGGDVDPRHFGVFGQESVALAHTNANTSALIAAMSYAGNHGVYLVLQSGYYEFAVGTYRIKGSASTYIFGSTGTIHMTVDDKVRFYNDDTYTATYDISGDILRSYQVESASNFTLSPRKFISNGGTADSKAITLSDCELEIVYDDLRRYTLTNVVIGRDSHLGYNANTTITNCRIARNMFTSAATMTNICTICHNCRTERSFWDTLSDYSIFVDSQAVLVYENSMSVSTLAAATLSATSVSVGTSVNTSTLTSVISSLGWATATRQSATQGFVIPIVRATTEGALRVAISNLLGGSTPAEGQAILAFPITTMTSTTVVTQPTLIFYVTTPRYDEEVITTNDWFWIGAKNGKPCLKTLAELYN